MVISAHPRSPVLLEDVLQRIEDISTLPHAMLQIIQVTNDPLSTARDLAGVLESDPALLSNWPGGSISASGIGVPPTGSMLSNDNAAPANSVVLR